MTALPRVTVLVPARDEAQHIAGCIEHIARQDYPANWIQVLVIDGRSRDGTGGIARRAFRDFNLADAHVLEHSTGTTPSNLNAGLEKASGEIICRVDARSYIEPHYVRTCVDVLSSRPEVAVVGGAQHAITVDSHPISVGIARALNNRYSMGFSRYRRASTAGPADTVYLGAFRADELRGAGGWDENLSTNQDFELNRRMSRSGIVWFDARLRTGYVPRPSLRLLWHQYVRFGRAKSRYWRSSGDRPQPRQMALLAAGPVGLAAVLAWLRLPRHAKALAVLGVVTGAALVEHVGATGPKARPAGRACALAAMGATTLGWLGGVTVEWLSPTSTSDA